MCKLTYENLHGALLAAVPELRGPYEGLVHGPTWQGEKPGQYIIFEDLLHPYLRQLLEREDNHDALGHLFALFEDMARSDDVEVVNLLAVAEIEWLFSHPKLLSRAWKYMGGRTKAVAREMVARAPHGHWKLPLEAGDEN